MTQTIENQIFRSRETVTGIINRDWELYKQTGDKDMTRLLNNTQIEQLSALGTIDDCLDGATPQILVKVVLPEDHEDDDDSLREEVAEIVNAAHFTVAWTGYEPREDGRCDAEISITFDPDAFDWKMGSGYTFTNPSALHDAGYTGKETLALYCNAGSGDNKILSAASVEEITARMSEEEYEDGVDFFVIPASLEDLYDKTRDGCK